MPGEGEVLGITVMLSGGVGGSVVLGAVHDPGLHRVDELVEAHGDAIASQGIHGVDEDWIAHHPNLEAFQVLDAPDRFLAVVDIARAGVHPAKPDKSCSWMVRQD